MNWMEQQRKILCATCLSNASNHTQFTQFEAERPEWKRENWKSEEATKNLAADLKTNKTI